MADCVIGDYIEVHGYQDTGSGQDIVGSLEVRFVA
jgi:hypothetical protein